MILNLKSLVILISLFAIYSCASFKPIVMANYDKKNYTGTDPTKCSGKFPQQDICSARKFTFDTTKKYKDEILKAYGETNNYDNGILGAVTLGIAARLASAHTDVFNALAVGLGYQTAVKTYNNESFKLQLYSNVIRATQCVYNNSSRLEAEASTADTIKIARDKFTAFQTLTSSQPAEVKKIYDEKFKSQQGEFSTFTQRISAAEKLADQAFEAFASAEATIIQALQEIEITVIQRFNGQLPDINQITSLIEQQIAANKKLDEEGSVEGIAIPATPQKEKFEKGKSPTEDQVSAINAQIEIIHSATLTLNNLASLRLDKYTADINLIKACPALL